MLFRIHFHGLAGLELGAADGRLTGDTDSPNPAYHHLREITRCRRALVRQKTAAQIILLAREALPPAVHRVATLQRTLAATVDLYQCLQRNALELRADAALTLATTPYVMLTSIPGIGFVLAAGLAGELGDPKHLGKLDSLCAYAGIVPSSIQTGGPDSPAVQGHVSPRCNRILKDWTVQSAQKIHLYGPPELKDRITRWNAKPRQNKLPPPPTRLGPSSSVNGALSAADLISCSTKPIPSASGAKSCWNFTASTSPHGHEKFSHQPAASNGMKHERD